MRILSLFALVFLFACNSGDDDFQPFKGKAPGSGDTELNPVIKSELPDVLSIDPEKDTISYLALGDSYTIGTGEKPENRYLILLSEAFTAQGFLFKTPRIVATNGWTSGNLIFAVNNPPIDTQYDLVSLLIGVNNQYSGGSFLLFQKEFIELIEFSLSKVKGRSGVFVLSIPDYGATPFGEANTAKIFEEINMYNDFIRKVCEANKIKYYDITEISRKAKDDLSYLAGDRLHPSRKMYLEWVDLIVKDPPALLAR
jgi:lysophospholipase L1-like esterase